MTTQTVNIQITVNGANPAARAIASVGGAAAKTNTSVFSLRKTLAAFALGGLTAQMAKFADTATRIDNRLNVLTGSTARSNELFNALFKTAQDTRSGIEATVDSYARLERSTMGLNLTTQQLIDLTKGINQSFQIFGNSSKEAEAAMVQFGQGLSVGVLRGDELRSVLEQAPRLAKAIADGLNELPDGKQLSQRFGRIFEDFKTGKISAELMTGSLRALGKEGALTADLITRGLLTQLPKLNEEFARTKPTIQNAFTVLQNSLVDVARSPVFQEISSQFGGMIIAVSDWITANKTAIAKFFAVFGQVGVFLAKVLGAFGKFFATIINNFVNFVTQFSGGMKTVEDNGKAGAENFGNGFIKVIGLVYEAFKTLVEVFARGAAAIGGFMGSLARNIGNLFGGDPAIEAMQRTERALKDAQQRGLKISEEGARKQFEIELKYVNERRKLTNPFEDAQAEADKVAAIVTATFKPIDSLADDLGTAFVEFSVDTVAALAAVDDAANSLATSTLGNIPGDKKVLPAGIELDANDQRRLDSFNDRLTELREKSLDGKEGLRELARATDQYNALLKDPEIAQVLTERSKQEAEFAELKLYYVDKTFQGLLAENKAEAEAAQVSLDHYAARRLLVGALKDQTLITPEMVNQLADVLKEEREIKAVQQQKESILQSLTRKAEEYNTVLAATNQLLKEGTINEGQQNRFLGETELGRQEQEIDSFIADNSLDPQDKVDAQIEALENEMMVRQSYLADMYAAEIDMKDEYEQKMTALTDIYNRQRSAIQMESERLQYESASTSFGDMAELSKGFVKESSGVYKALFFASKAFAIADGIVKLNQAIMNASVSLPFPANIAAMAAVGAQGLSLLASIKGAFMPDVALRDGGWVSGPGGPRDDGVKAALSNGEFVVNSASAARNADLLEAINSGRFNAGQGDNSMTLNLTQNFSGMAGDQGAFRQSGRQAAEETARAVERARSRVT